jgi:hypothetical protein
MSNRIIYTTLSLYPDIADRIVKVKEDYGLKNNNEAVQVLLTAFDIINNTGHGGDFTEAVKTVLGEGKES